MGEITARQNRYIICKTYTNPRNDTKSMSTKGRKQEKRAERVNKKSARRGARIHQDFLPKKAVILGEALDPSFFELAVVLVPLRGVLFFGVER